MAYTNFDKFFLHLPPFDRKDDFIPFWNKALKELKKIPIDSLIEINKKKSTSKFEVFKINYNGFMKTQLYGELYSPKGIKKPKPIILIHDYNNLPDFNSSNFNNEYAYFVVILRGHDHITQKSSSNEEEETTPGYLIENILDKDTYYMKAVYLDIYRTIDMLRLIKTLDCSSIGIIGKGMGAAAAIFTASFHDRIKALVLETPSFCYLTLNQNRSSNDATYEINDFIAKRKGKKKQIKENLTYFDALNFSDMIKIPVLATTGLKDTISPPECVFAMFNHLLCEKSIEVYPDEGNSAGGDKQLVKSIKWLTGKIL